MSEERTLEVEDKVSGGWSGVGVVTTNVKLYTKLTPVYRFDKLYRPKKEV